MVSPFQHLERKKAFLSKMKKEDEMKFFSEEPCRIELLYLGD